MSAPDVSLEPDGPETKARKAGVAAILRLYPVV
jgi:hypothetical protein